MNVILVNKNSGATTATPLGSLPPGGSSIREVTPRQLLAAKSSLDALSTNLFYSVWSVSVRDFGAVGNGAIDDTVALNLAYSTVQALGGGTVTWPAGIYRTTDRVVNGYRFVDEAECSITTPDVSALPSFDSDAYALARAANPVHTVFEGGAGLWLDYTGAKAGLYNGIVTGGGAKNAGRVRYENVRVFGQPAMASGGTKLSPSTASASSSTQDAFFAAGTKVQISNFYSEETARGLVAISCYWSRFDGIEGFHNARGMVAPGSNAVEATSLTFSYATTSPLELSGQGFDFGGLATEESGPACVQSADGGRLQLKYLEGVGTGLTDYALKIGDGTNNVVELALEIPHLGTLHGKSILLASHAQATIRSGSHLYTPDAAHGIHLTDSTCVLWLENNVSADIDPGGDQTNIYRLDSGQVRTGQLKTAGSVYSQQPLELGFSNLWVDNDWATLRFKYGNAAGAGDPSGAKNGAPCSPIVGSASWTSPAAIAAGAHDDRTLSFPCNQGDAVWIAVNGEDMPAGVQFSWYVTAANTIRLRIFNGSASSYTPGSFPYTIYVWVGTP